MAIDHIVEKAERGRIIEEEGRSYFQYFLKAFVGQKEKNRSRRY